MLRRLNSDTPAAFDEVDQRALEAICAGLGAQFGDSAVRWNSPAVLRRIFLIQ